MNCDLAAFNNCPVYFVPYLLLIFPAPAKNY